MGEIKPVKPDGKTQPGAVPTVAPQISVGNLAQAAVTAAGSTAAAIVVVQAQVDATSDATQAQYKLQLQYLRNYGGKTVN